ncbi:MAG: OmpA family protein [Rhodospirillaceae bacterium]
MLKKVLLAATAVGMLSACAARWDVEGVAGLPVQGGAFNEALHKEYLDRAKTERARYDWVDTEYFLNKARAAAAGETVLPQPVAERDLTEAEAENLGAARSALITRLDGGARSGAAPLAARAQAGFDCIIEETEEFTKEDELALCNDMYQSAMNALEPTPAPAPKAAVDGGPFIVFFENASSRIDASAREVLNAAARAYSGAAPVTVVISGHTDTTGADQLNMLLSQRRAEAVADALSMLGVPPRDMALEAYGEEQLKIKTPNAVAEPRNRRVEVVFRKPAN